MKTFIKITYLASILLMLASISIAISQAQTIKTNPITDAYVPNSETAIKIAEAIWLPIFGESIYKEKPFKAILIKDSIWYVHGTLHTPIGGTVNIEIQKSDCKILSVSHGK